MSSLRRLWHEQRLVLIAFVIACSLALFFGGRTVLRAIYWSNPEHRQQHPEAWMTPGYIARSWHLRVEDVDAALGIDDDRRLVPEGPPTLERLAQVLGVPVSTLVARLETALPALAQGAQDPGRP